MTATTAGPVVQMPYKLRRTRPYGCVEKNVKKNALYLRLWWRNRLQTVFRSRTKTNIELQLPARKQQIEQESYPDFRQTLRTVDIPLIGRRDNFLLYDFRKGLEPWRLAAR